MAKSEKRMTPEPPSEQEAWTPKINEIDFLTHEELAGSTPIPVCAYCGDSIEKVREGGLLQWTPCTCLDALKHYAWTLEADYLERQVQKLEIDVRRGANRSRVGILEIPLVHRKVLLKFMEGVVYEKRISPRK